MKKNTKNRERLFKAVERSYSDLEWARNLQRNLVAEYAGDGYGGNKEGGKRKEIIVNLLNQTVEAYMVQLAANRPRVLVSTKHEHLKAFAQHYQLAMNNLLEEIGLEHTIRRWVLDAFFCLGIVKVHMASSGLVEIEKDVWADPGKPFASNVSLDNWVHDASATKWSEMTFCGDVYRIAHEDLQDESIYNQDVAREIKPTSKRDQESDRLENIGKGYETDVDEFYPMVDLMDIWLPREGLIETYPVKFQHSKLVPYGEPVAVLEWEGSEHGPYKQLSFNEVPENIMPSSPASHLQGLARHINNVYRKQMKGARDFKEVTTYMPGGKDQARNLHSARHGDMVAVQDPREIGRVAMGGVDANLQQFLLNMMDDYNSAAGNLTAMLGLGAQAETVGQERLIHAASGAKPAHMASRVMDAVVSLVRDLGHLLWHDQVNVIPGQQQVDGVDGYVVQSDWRPDDREGDFLDYNLSVDVYSMQYKSPSQRVSELFQVLNQYAPFMEMLHAQGGMVNLQKLNEIVADLADLPRLKEVVQFTSAVPEAGMESGGQPANTTREYIRRSVPTGGSAQGRNVMRQQAWAGQATAQQGATMARPPA